MTGLLQDLRFVLRTLGKRRLYTLATVVVFALAIGANSTVFSVLNGLLLRPLPYPDDDRLVIVYSSYPKMGLDDAGTSIPDYLDRREQAASLESLAMIIPGTRTWRAEGPPERVSVASAPPSLFDVLRIAPVLGRPFDASEATPGGDPVVLLSHRLWRTRFGAENVLDREIRLDGVPHRVIGVMPEGFNFLEREVDVWLPLVFTPQEAGDSQRGQSRGISVGRLRDGATVEGLDVELGAIARRYAEAAPPEMAAFIESTGFTGRAVALREFMVGDLDRIVLMLQGIVLIVVLIACANVMNLQLSRTAARRAELSVRTALGASRWRVGRLVLAESIVLATIGAALGLTLAAVGLEVVQALGLDRSLEGFEFALDRNVLAFTAATAVVAASISCLFPVVAFARESLVRGLNEAGRRAADAPVANRFRSALVIAQIAASLALITGAGLLAQSFYRLIESGPGFDVRNVLSASIALPADRYETPEARTRFYDEVLDVVGALPGVTIAGLTSVLPFSGLNVGATLPVDGYTPPPGGSPPVAQLRSISPRYFASLDIPVVAGRSFAAREADRVAIIDEVMASLYWPAGDALGQRIGNPMDPTGAWYTVVGVVPFVKHGSLTEGRDRPTIYYHYAQTPPDVGVLTLRTSIAPELVRDGLRAAIARLDPGVAVFDAVPMDVRVRRSLGPQRAPMVLTVMFAALAFVLAVIGIYGVLASTVTQRVGEIGVRMALGAGVGDVERLIVRQGASMIVAGLALGAGAAILLGRVLSSRIEYVGGLDFGVLTAAAALLAVAALLASWLPAKRAARIDPMQALRTG